MSPPLTWRAGICLNSGYMSSRRWGCFELDRLDEALLLVAHRPEPVGLEEVVLRRARELELRERLGVAAHPDVVDADAGGVEEGLDALGSTCPPQASQFTVPAAAAGAERCRVPSRRGARRRPRHCRRLQEFPSIRVRRHAGLLGRDGPAASRWSRSRWRARGKHAPRRGDPTTGRPSALPRSLSEPPALHAVEPVCEHFLSVGEADEVVRDEAESAIFAICPGERGARRGRRRRDRRTRSGRTSTAPRRRPPRPAGAACAATRPDPRDRHLRLALAEALHPSREDVGRADELHHEAVGGVTVDLRRRADLQDPAPVHHRDAVRHRQRLVLVVGHVHEGDPDPALQPRELGLHLLAQLEVERAERLVEQQHRRLVDQGARQRHPLALAAAELARAPLLERPRARPGRSISSTARRRSARGDLLHAQAEPHVVGHAHVREQRVALEHGVHGPRVRRRVPHRLAVDQERAAGGGLEAADQVQRRGLAAAARSRAARRTRPCGS